GVARGALPDDRDLGEVPDPCSPYSTASRPTDWSITTDERAREQEELVRDRLAIAGSGAIACGLAATAAHHGPVLLLARSTSSADRARATVEKTLSGLGAEIDGAAAAGDGQHVQIVTDPAALAPASLVVEA